VSSDKPRRTKTIWDVEFDKQVPDADLVAFNQHKNALLAILRNEHARGPKSKSFDADESWRGLNHLAQLYFWSKKIKLEARPASDHVERLRDLAKALGRTRSMVDRAMQDDVGRDLFRFANTNKSPAAAVRDDNGSFDVVHLAETIKNVVAGLGTLEAAAKRAARNMRTRGRPEGTSVLPRGHIIALANVYRKSTGLKPAMGAGPFAQLVEEFLTALGRGDDISEDYVVEAIKYARKQERKNPSMFGFLLFDK
jgi:hypothetical protein